MRLTECTPCCEDRTLTSIKSKGAEFKIPLIDLSKYISATSQAEKRQTADAIVEGFRTVGFVYLEKHGIPEAQVKHTFAKVRPNNELCSVDEGTQGSSCRARSSLLFLMK